jgi:hypothetical protein
VIDLSILTAATIDDQGALPPVGAVAADSVAQMER